MGKVPKQREVELKQELGRQKEENQALVKQNIELLAKMKEFLVTAHEHQQQNMQQQREQMRVFTQNQPYPFSPQGPQEFRTPAPLSSHQSSVAHTRNPSRSRMFQQRAQSNPDGDQTQETTDADFVYVSGNKRFNPPTAQIMNRKHFRSGSQCLGDPPVTSRNQQLGLQLAGSLHGVGDAKMFEPCL